MVVFCYGVCWQRSHSLLQATWSHQLTWVNLKFDLSQNLKIKRRGWGGVNVLKKVRYMWKWQEQIKAKSGGKKSWCGSSDFPAASKFRHATLLLWHNNFCNFQPPSMHTPVTELPFRGMVPAQSTHRRCSRGRSCRRSSRNAGLWGRLPSWLKLTPKRTGNSSASKQLNTAGKSTSKNLQPRICAS